MLKDMNEKITFHSSVSPISGPAGPQGEPGVAGKQFQFNPFVCAVDIFKRSFLLPMLT